MDIKTIILITLFIITSGIAGFLTWLIVYKWKLGSEANPLVSNLGLWAKIPFTLAIVGIAIWKQSWIVMVIPNLISIADMVNNVIVYFKIRKRR